MENPENCHYSELALKVCRICLAMDKKLYPIRKCKLDEVYENLTGFMVNEQDKLPQKLCYECVQRLINSSRFRMKSLTAMGHMMQIVKNQDHLTIKSLKSISRVNNQLASTLAPKYFASNHYDYLLEDSSKKNDAVQKNNSEFLEELDFVIDTEDNQNWTMDSSDDSLHLGVSKRQKKKEGSSKTMRKRLIKEKNSEIVKCMECLKTFVDQAEYDCHLASHEEESSVYLIPNTLLPKYHETNNDISVAEIEIDMKSENNHIDINSEVEDESDVKIEDSIDIASETDYTTDDSLVPEVKKRKKETKKVKKSPQKDDTEPKRNMGGKPLVTLNKMLFDVTELTFEEQVAEIEKRKETSSYKNALFKCVECYKGYLDENAYNSHMLKHTNECGEHGCPVCKNHFKHPRALRKHLIDHHKYRYSCKQCPYATANKYSALLHERWHKGTKYSCPHCPDEFLKFSTYMSHLRIKHPSDFVCQLCGFSFVSEKGKNQHIKLKHRKENAPIPVDGPHCEPCNIRFMSTEALKQHISVSARHYSGDKAALKPNKPKYGRKTKDNIKRAIDNFGKKVEIRHPKPRQIKPEGPIHCEQCGVQLKDSRAYYSHFRRMHPGENRTNYPSIKAPCMCEVCGRIFQSCAQLKYHRWCHTGENRFECESCGKSFSLKERLVAHIRRLHSTEKRTYPCSVCGKTFTENGNRKRHMVIHSGLRQFKCEMCGKTFKYKYEKTSHINYVHLKKPKRKRDSQVPKQPPSVMPTPDMSM